ncbi:MAG: hypothetical protein N2Z76_04330 [Treponemataceae bacterium]|nr:hypothetical protein [Treponemataceae bacterium]
MNLQQMLGAFLIITAVFVGIGTYQSTHIEAFYKRGQPVTAKILKKYSIDRSKPWGNPAVSRYARILQRDYYFEVSLSTAPTQPSKAFQFVTATLSVSPQLGATLTQGASLEVLYIPQDPEGTVIARQDFEKGRHSLDETTKKRYAEEAKVSRSQVKRILENGKVEVYFSASPTLATVSFVTVPVPVDGSLYRSYEAGDTIDVIYLPGNQEQAIATEMLKSLIYIPSWVGILGAAISTIIGLWFLFLKK